MFAPIAAIVADSSICAQKTVSTGRNTMKLVRNDAAAGSRYDGSGIYGNVSVVKDLARLNNDINYTPAVRVYNFPF